MRKNIFPFLILSIFCVMTFCMLRFPQMALSYSTDGLLLWFNKMIPSLLPFMILSGILIRMNLSDHFASMFSPVIRPLFRISSACIYVVVIGFLCGFPMGAKVCAESLNCKKISEKEAQFLLGFCNNIGPVYVTGYMLKLFPVQTPVLLMIGMYGIPVFYGLIARYTVYRDIKTNYISFRHSHEKINFFQALNQSIISSLDSITVLGGYMIFCNLMNLLPTLILKGSLLQLIGGLLEITSGLSRMQNIPIWVAYAMLTFGGLSCIAQTSSCIRGTGLSLKRYVFDKSIQTAIALIYYRILLV